MDVPFINRLPPELLVAIASFTDQSTIFRLAMVCRHWHDVLTETPTLWASIHCRSRSRTSILLQRSKSSPIDVIVDRAHYVPEAVPLVASHTNRMRSIRVILVSRELEDFQSLLNGPAPILGEMWMQGRDHNPTRSLPLCSPSFQGQFPALRILSLLQYPFDLTQSVPMTTNGLTELVLHSTRQSHHLRNLLDYLEHCKNLKYLDIRLPDLRGDVLAPRTVSLPKLRKLQLVSFPPTALHHLSFPPSTHLAIQSHGWTYADNYQSVDIGAQDGLLHIFESRTIKRIEMKVVGSNCVVRLSGSRLALTVTAFIILSHPHPSSPHLSTFRSDFLDTLQSLPIETTTFFGFAQPSPPPFIGTHRQQSCTQLLKKMPALEEIALDTSVAPLFIRALEPVDGDLLCPKLQHFILILGDDRDEVVLRIGLLDLSNRRKEHGSPLTYTIESYGSSDWWEIPVV